MIDPNYEHKVPQIKNLIDEVYKTGYTDDDALYLWEDLFCIFWNKGYFSSIDMTDKDTVIELAKIIHDNIVYELPIFGDRYRILTARDLGVDQMELWLKFIEDRTHMNGDPDYHNPALSIDEFWQRYNPKEQPRLLQDIDTVVGYRNHCALVRLKKE